MNKDVNKNKELLEQKREYFFPRNLEKDVKLRYVSAEYDDSGGLVLMYSNRESGEIVVLSESEICGLRQKLDELQNENLKLIEVNESWSNVADESNVEQLHNELSEEKDKNKLLKEEISGWKEKAELAEAKLEIETSERIRRINEKLDMSDQNGKRIDLMIKAFDDCEMWKNRASLMQKSLKRAQVFEKAIENALNQINLDEDNCKIEDWIDTAFAELSGLYEVLYSEEIEEF